MPLSRALSFLKFQSINPCTIQRYWIRAHILYILIVIVNVHQTHDASWLSPSTVRYHLSTFHPRLDLIDAYLQLMFLNIHVHLLDVQDERKTILSVYHAQQYWVSQHDTLRYATIGCGCVSKRWCANHSGCLFHVVFFFFSCHVFFFFLSFRCNAIFDSAPLALALALAVAGGVLGVVR